MPKKSPRTEAIAFMIWRYATPIEWNCTIPEVAEAIGKRQPVVRGIVIQRGWHTRMRKVPQMHDLDCPVKQPHTTIKEIQDYVKQRH